MIARFMASSTTDEFSDCKLCDEFSDRHLVKS